MFNVSALARKAFAAVMVLALASCQQPAIQADPPAQNPAVEAWDRYASAFLESYFAAHPETAIWAGRHEYDGRLPDWSADGIRREIVRLHAERERASAFPEDGLDVARRLERDYLISRIDRDLFWLESADWPSRSPTFYQPALEPDVYVGREYAPLPDRLRAFTRYERAIPVAAAQIRANLHAPLPRTYVQRGHILFGGLARFYEKDVPRVFAAVDDARLQAEFQAANAGAIQAMKDLDTWMGTLEGTATDAFALGQAKFSEMLRASERVDVPLTRLREIAQQDLERNLSALGEACRAWAANQSVKDCVAKMKADKPEGSPVLAARQQLILLRSFVVQKQLVSIPGPELAVVEETPEYNRFNSAQIRVPGPYDGSLPSKYQIAPPDPAWSKAEQDAYIPGKADLLFTSAHEVWPGHFLQFMHARRSPSKIGQVFASYAFVEGWAHYSEEMMWEAGLGDGDPETHVGQLVAALLRNVRLVSAIGLHAGTMTFADSEQMFREQAFQDPASARQQAARGTIDPGYGNYTLGKLMFMKLREDWTASRGGRAAWKDFHDELLRYGSPPIPLVRDAMLGTVATPPL